MDGMPGATSSSPGPKLVLPVLDRARVISRRDSILALDLAVLIFDFQPPHPEVSSIRSALLCRTFPGTLSRTFRANSPQNGPVAY